MQSTAPNPEQYLAELPEDRKAAMLNFRTVIKDNLPKGFEETISYGMLCYVVPKAIYPNGYHCNPQQALPFISLASQKNFIALYHMGIYADKQLLDWFVAEYPKYVKTKLDIGKSCIRFKKPDDIPFDLIAELMRKMTVQDWITLYETNLKG
ncbi:DUF1801 domain-containing protein [Flavobacterium sp.]